MAGTTWQTVPKRIVPSKPKKHSPTKVFDFKKLFPTDKQPSIGGTTGQSLADIRKLIYDFAWSRDRRDEAKSDFVVSEFGTDRNVMHYSHYYDQHDDLKRTAHVVNRCNLMFANKEISDEFLQHIYSINTLEIDVDLKRRDTPEARAALGNIMARLRANPNFQKYTQFIRVRIHFPDNYPLHNLPAINQVLLEELSDYINGCQKLAVLNFFHVMMEGMNDYELRYAAFPFYPLNFTRWNISVLNLQTYQFERMTADDLDYLDQAWDDSKEHGTLATNTARVQPKKPPVPTRPISPTGLDPQTASSQKGATLGPTSNEYSTKNRSKNKNGSKKKKERKSGGQVTPPQSTPPSVVGDHVATQKVRPPSPPSTPLTPSASTESLIPIPDNKKQDDSRVVTTVNAAPDPVKGKLPVKKVVEPMREATNGNPNIGSTPSPEQAPVVSPDSQQHEDPPISQEEPQSPARSSSSSDTMGRNPPRERVADLDIKHVCKKGTLGEKNEDGGVGQPERQDQPKSKKARERQRQRERARRKRKEKAAAKSPVGDDAHDINPSEAHVVVEALIEEDEGETSPSDQARFEEDESETGSIETPAGEPTVISVTGPLEHVISSKIQEMAESGGFDVVDPRRVEVFRGVDRLQDGSSHSADKPVARAEQRRRMRQRQLPNWGLHKRAQARHISSPPRAEGSSPPERPSKAKRRRVKEDETIHGWVSSIHVKPQELFEWYDSRQAGKKALAEVDEDRRLEEIEDEDGEYDGGSLVVEEDCLSRDGNQDDSIDEVESDTESVAGSSASSRH